MNIRETFHSKRNNSVKLKHQTVNGLHKKHNGRVAQFHNHHISQIEHGENGTGLLARWERFIYEKGKKFFH